MTDSSRLLPHPQPAARRVHAALREGELQAVRARAASSCAPTPRCASTPSFCRTRSRRRRSRSSAARPPSTWAPARRAPTSSRIHAPRARRGARAQGRRVALVRVVWRRPRPARKPTTYGVSHQRQHLAREPVRARRPLGEQPRLRHSSARRCRPSSSRRSTSSPAATCPSTAAPPAASSTSSPRSGSNEFHGSVFTYLHARARSRARASRSAAKARPSTGRAIALVHRRLRLRRRRPHHQGQALVLRGLRHLRRAATTSAGRSIGSCSTRGNPVMDDLGLHASPSPSRAPTRLRGRAADHPGHGQAHLGARLQQPPDPDRSTRRRRASGGADKFSIDPRTGAPSRHGHDPGHVRSARAPAHRRAPTTPRSSGPPSSTTSTSSSTPPSAGTTKRRLRFPSDGTEPGSGQGLSDVWQVFW